MSWVTLHSWNKHYRTQIVLVKPIHPFPRNVLPVDVWKTILMFHKHCLAPAKARYILASFPGPKRRERAWFQPFVHVLNYLGYHHVLISGRVPMTPSKSHGWLYDVGIHRFKPASLAKLQNLVELVYEKWLSTGKTTARGNLGLHCTSVCPFCWRSSLISCARLLAKALR